MEQLERQTYIMKLMLVLMRDRKARQAQVRNVGYLREYGELPEDIGVSTLGSMSDEELLLLATQIGIKKRPATGKSDVYMNDLGYMLIWKGQQTTLVDGVSLQQMIELAKELQLLELVNDLVDYSEQLGVIDLSGSDETKRKQWKKLLSHLMCQGTTPSRFPAELVLCYYDPLNMNTWDIYEAEAYIEVAWGQIKLKVDEVQCVNVVVEI